MKVTEQAFNEADRIWFLDVPLTHFERDAIKQVTDAYLQNKPVSKDAVTVLANFYKRYYGVDRYGK